MARPKWEPPDLKLVEKLASNGLSEAQIAASVGVSVDTIARRKKDNAGFAEAIRKGKALGVVVVTNALMAAIKSGNVRAMEIYLKCRAGWRETNILELPPGKRIEDMTDNELIAIIEGRKI